MSKTNWTMNCDFRHAQQCKQQPLIEKGLNEAHHMISVTPYPTRSSPFCYLDGLHLVINPQYAPFWLENKWVGFTIHFKPRSRILIHTIFLARFIRSQTCSYQLHVIIHKFTKRILH